MTAKRAFTKADPAAPRLTTSAMIASLAAEGQRTKPAPFGHALAELAQSRPCDLAQAAIARNRDRGGPARGFQLVGASDTDRKSVG